MEFKFEINLRRMAVLAYAKSFWNTEEMRFKLKQFYYPYGRLGKMKYLRQLIEEVRSKVDLASLPLDLYSDVIKVIGDVVYKEYDWFHFIRRRKIFRDQSRRQIYDKFCKDIYWTHYGTIDEVKILKYSWLGLPNADVKKIFVMASCFCSEEVIDEIWAKMNGNIEAGFYKKLCNQFGFHLAAYWFKRKENKLHDFVNDVVIPFPATYSAEKSLEVNMLRWSALKGFLSPFKYFWNKLNKQEKEQNFKWCLVQSLDEYSQRIEEDYYRKDQLAEIIFLLIHFLDEDLKFELFQKTLSRYSSLLEYNNKFGYFKVIMMIVIRSWPWREFFQPTFKKFENLLDDDKYEFLINTLVDNSPGKSSFFQGLFHQMWNRTKSKKEIAERNLVKLFDIWDVNSMKLTIHDNIFFKMRGYVLKELHPKLISLIRKDEMSKFDQFIDQILIPGIADEDFHGFVKSIYGYLIKGDIGSADKLLDPALVNIEKLKREIDAEILCFYFVIKNQYEQADKFLNWKFEDSDKVENFKKKFESSDFIRDQIHNLWKVPKENVELAKENSDKFLRWLLITEKRVIAFKAGEILSRELEGETLKKSLKKKFRYSMYTDFIDDDHLDILEDFLRWSFLNDQAVQQLKKEILEKRIGYIFWKFTRTGRFDELRKILKWTFSSDDEIFDFMRKELISEDGIVSCKLFISKYSCPNSVFEPKPTVEELTVKFKNFIDFLVGPLKDFKLFKKELGDWPGLSRKLLEEIESDAGSTDEFYSEGSDPECNRNWIYCDVDNYNLFLNLVNEVEKST